jgi:hypothetical protein
MDFENARWVKLYCQDTGTWLRLGWQGRTLALHLLRAVNASGVLSDLGDEPELILAELLRLPVEVVSPGIAALLRTETITLANGVLVWRKFVEAQKSRKSEAQRKAEYRAKHRADAIKAQGGTDCPESGTDGPDEGQERPHVPSDGDKKSQKRRDKNRKKRTDKKPSGSSAGADPAQLGMPLGDEGVVEPPKDEEPDPVAAEQHLAIHVFGYLLAARKRCKPSARTVEPTETHLKEITRCLREGIEAQDLIHVVDVWEAQVKSGRQDMAHFDSVTPFRAANVAKYLQMSLDDARKPRGQAPQAMRPPEPPKSPTGNPPGGLNFKELRDKVEADRTPEGDAKIKAELDRILGRTPT